MPSEIILPAGTEFVETANIPELIAEALNPKPANEPRLGRQTESDSAEVKSAAFRRYQVEREHRAMMCCAIADGKLKALSRSSRRRVTVHEPDSIVMVSELAKYVEQFGISVNVTDKTKAAYLQAAYDETGLNGNAINWRYWVHQLPVISAAQAACLMSALEPDLFANLDGRNWQDNPARIDPARNIEKARKIQRLAEAQGKPSASPAEWVGWAQAQSLAVHTGFLLEVEEWLETTSVQGDAAPAVKGNDVFRLMPNLTAAELNITFVGGKPEPNSDIGANNFLEISARGETRRIALAALDLVNKQSGGLNRMGVMLLGFAKNFDPPDSGANAQTISRLRHLFQEHLGLKSDPFDPKAAKWKPHFKIVDKRGAADERAKREAERNTISYELMNERGERAGDIREQPYDDEGDDTAKWLENNLQA